MIRSNYDPEAKMRRELEKEIREKKLRRAEVMIERSGLKELIAENTFDSFVDEEPWQKRMKRIALEYASDPTGWIIFCGQSGSGKTHLCTAIAGEMMRKNGVPVAYMLWRQHYMKASRYEEEDFRDELRRCDCLYIDDLFKGLMTDAQVALAFDLLDARYRSNKPTIISTELSMEDIGKVDEAIYGRIKHRARGRIVDIKKDGARNQRLHA